jgi:hypothetical protein
MPVSRDAAFVLRESGDSAAPEGTMLDMMDPMSGFMRRRYSHLRAKARGEAMDAPKCRVSLGAPGESPESAICRKLLKPQAV